MKRREFITMLGSTAATWPLAAHAQLNDRVRRIAVLMGFAENDEGLAGLSGDLQTRLQDFGWTDGRNVRPPAEAASCFGLFA